MSLHIARFCRPTSFELSRVRFRLKRFHYPTRSGARFSLNVSAAAIKLQFGSNQTDDQSFRMSYEGETTLLSHVDKFYTIYMWIHVDYRRPISHGYGFLKGTTRNDEI